LDSKAKKVPTITAGRAKEDSQSIVPPQKDQLVTVAAVYHHRRTNWFTVAAVFLNQGQSCGGDKARSTCNGVGPLIEMGSRQDHLKGDDHVFVIMGSASGTKSQRNGGTGQA
jgi:hypothetical protein